MSRGGLNYGAKDRQRLSREAVRYTQAGGNLRIMQREERIAALPPVVTADQIEGCPPHHWLYPGAGEQGDIVCRKCGEPKQ